jgi:hypothetical protein
MVSRQRQFGAGPFLPCEGKSFWLELTQVDLGQPGPRESARVSALNFLAGWAGLASKVEATIILVAHGSPCSGEKFESNTSGNEGQNA